MIFLQSSVHLNLCHLCISVLNKSIPKYISRYVMVARQIRPKLSRDAADLIAEKYCDLRTQDAATSAAGGGPGATNLKRTQPITARTLETLIRLSTSYAKARMSKNVSKEDAKKAADLVSFAIFKEVLEKRRRKRDRGSEDEGESEEESEEEEEEAEEPENRDVSRPPRKRR